MNQLGRFRYFSTRGRGAANIREVFKRLAKFYVLMLQSDFKSDPLGHHEPCIDDPCKKVAKRKRPIPRSIPHGGTRRTRKRWGSGNRRSGRKKTKKKRGGNGKEEEEEEDEKAPYKEKKPVSGPPPTYVEARGPRNVLAQSYMPGSGFTQPKPNKARQYVVSFLPKSAYNLKCSTCTDVKGRDNIVKVTEAMSNTFTKLRFRPSTKAWKLVKKICKEGEEKAKDWTVKDMLGFKIPLGRRVEGILVPMYKDGPHKGFPDIFAMLGADGRTRKLLDGGRAAYNTWIQEQQETGNHAYLTQDECCQRNPRAEGCDKVIGATSAIISILERYRQNLAKWKQAGSFNAACRILSNNSDYCDIDVETLFKERKGCGPSTFLSVWINKINADIGWITNLSWVNGLNKTTISENRLADPQLRAILDRLNEVKAELKEMGTTQEGSESAEESDILTTSSSSSSSSSSSPSATAVQTHGICPPQEMRNDELLSKTGEIVSLTLELIGKMDNVAAEPKKSAKKNLDSFLDEADEGTTKLLTHIQGQARLLTGSQVAEKARALEQSKSFTTAQRGGGGGTFNLETTFPIGSFDGYGPLNKIRFYTCGTAETKNEGSKPDEARYQILWSPETSTMSEADIKERAKAMDKVLQEWSQWLDESAEKSDEDFYDVWEHNPAEREMLQLIAILGSADITSAGKLRGVKQSKVKMADVKGLPNNDAKSLWDIANEACYVRTFTGTNGNGNVWDRRKKDLGSIFGNVTRAQKLARVLLIDSSERKDSSWAMQRSSPGSREEEDRSSPQKEGELSVMKAIVQYYTLRDAVKLFDRLKVVHPLWFGNAAARMVVATKVGIGKAYGKLPSKAAIKARSKALLAASKGLKDKLFNAVGTAGRGVGRLIAKAMPARATPGPYSTAQIGVGEGPPPCDEECQKRADDIQQVSIFTTTLRDTKGDIVSPGYSMEVFRYPSGNSPRVQTLISSTAANRGLIATPVPSEEGGKEDEGIEMTTSK